jgi:predicted ArsR family transcriptional regulator
MTDGKVMDYLKTHEKVKNIVKKKAFDDAYCCVKVDDVANELGIDSKTAKVHLDLMEIDEFGSYVDREQEVFCSMDGIERLRNRFKKKLAQE